MNAMRDFRQKEKKNKLPQNKPSRDESCLPYFPGVISRLCPDQPPMVVLLIVMVWGEGEKKAQHNHGQKVPIALLMNCVNAAMFLGSADPTMDEV